MYLQLGAALLTMAFLAACWGTASNDVQPPATKEVQPKKRTRTFNSTTQMRPRYIAANEEEFMEEFVNGFDKILSGKPFAASFWADEHCSATLIGPRVLLSAAHCFESDTDVAIEFDGEHYYGLCDTAKKFTGGAVDADLVLCRMKKDVPVPWFETLSFDPDLVKKDDRLMLTGFGGSPQALIKPGTYLAGETVVASVADGIAITSGGAFLQEGDSGGAGYVSVKPGKRFLISVNTSVVTKAKTSSVHLLSAARLFFEQWVKGDKICGFDQQGLVCRS